MAGSATGRVRRPEGLLSANRRSNRDATRLGRGSRRSRRLRTALLPLLLALLPVAAPEASAATTPLADTAQPAATTVQVVVRDSRLTLSRKRVPAGPVRFAVVNRGTRAHAFVVAGRRTPPVAPGKRAELSIRLRRTGPSPVRALAPGQSRRGPRGTIVVLERGLVLRRVVDVPGGAVHVTAPPQDARRLFVVEKEGAVRVLVDGKLLARPFLDLRSQVRSIGSEQGLLSLAFAPDYATSRRFYVYYVDRNGDARLVEFRRSQGNPNRADPATRRQLLFFEHPSGDHYGGLLLFGPDGYLYLGLGDGGLSEDREPRRAQWHDHLFGKIIRIDPRPQAGRPYRIPRSNPFVGRSGWRGEIWARGLRNPWRYWIDRVTGDLYVGDAGEFVLESIDYAPRTGGRGANFGWPCNEGTLRHAEYPASLCPGSLPPLYQYPRQDGNCAVIGGLVVRDPRLPAHAGDYLFSDFCRGDVRRLRRRGAAAPVVTSLGLGKAGLSSFGVDALGRVYVTVFSGGLVYRLDPKT